MKFSHSIQFNAVPDWSSNYLAYSNLKKLIYQLEKTTYHSYESDDAETALLVSVQDPDNIFRKALDTELEKISKFYQAKELEIYGEITKLLKDEEEFYLSLNQLDGQDLPTSHRPTTSLSRPRASSLLWGSRARRESNWSELNDEVIEENENDGTDENAAPCKPRSDSEPNKLVSRDFFITQAGLRGPKRGHGKSNSLTARLASPVRVNDDQDEMYSHLNLKGKSLRKRITNLYVQLCEIKSFVQLNRTGFCKVLKKYDKILGKSLKTSYMESRVDVSVPFQSDTAKHREERIEKLEHVYAKLVTGDDLVLAKEELRSNVREHVVWERNTVWREMIGIERKSQAAHLGLRTIIGTDDYPALRRLQGDDIYEMDMKVELATPFGIFLFPKLLINSTIFYLLAIGIIFILLLIVPMNIEAEQQNCLAMLVFVSLLWATETIPLFVTSLLIPFLSVVLRIVRSDEIPSNRLEPEDAAKYIFAAMWTPVIMLLLGGFTIAAALSKYNIARQIATFVLCKAGNNPKTVLITNMFVASFASMWISNVAAPVLCFSIIQPMLRNLPPESQMSKALILGIALASNIGGMLSPIASPQNIVAIQIMQPPPSWGVWFFIALPVGIISNFIIWIILLVSFRPSKGTTIVLIRPVKDKFTGVQWFVSIVTFATIILWCLSHQLEWLLGDMGVIAIIPIVLFFGTGILTKEDFNNFLWTIIILAAGGLSLGKAVESSGLLNTIASEITAGIEDLNVYSVLAIFATLILIVATFISHTVAALIILPILYSVGTSMEDQHPNLLVMGGALMCSAAMGLPTSGFPNMTAIMMENPQTGQRYLNVKHFITRGVPSSIISLLVVLSVGYALMYIVGM
ncbi:putative transporter C3B8.04c [Golovinomyces cichoracearum]|uniref:Putative transporter C3B8.04c n=1 Tax=Golovinomyces cichoracearum TaxID=62708 RepID=A0A420HKG7_9PEZI|nr:putative transporter C3B8.04c [Golovinomyces cichoracearum]